MRPKTLVLMGVAACAGLAAAFLASLYRPPGDARTTLVLVAAADLQIGTPIEPEKHLTLKPFLPDSVPQGAVANVEDLRGKVLGRNIPQNSPVTTRDLNLNAGVLEGVPKGTRAVTIRVTLENAQAGFTLPGAHVDLICTLPDPRDARRTLTKTFMQRVLVLAVNTQNQVPADGRTITNPGTVTLAVKPAEAERIIWAKERGSITMTLRKADDKEIVATTGTRDAFGGLVDVDDTKRPETVRILVARKQIPPNTRIDNVAEYFEAVSYPVDLVPNAILEKDSARLQQETVRHLVPEKSPLTTAHLQLAGPDRAVTWLGILEGPKPAKYYKFVDGRSAVPPDAEPANAGPEPDRPTPAPVTPKRDE
jgi:pilus assembly protein CpaB